MEERLSDETYQNNVVGRCVRGVLLTSLRSGKDSRRHSHLLVAVACSALVVVDSSPYGGIFSHHGLLTTRLRRASDGVGFAYRYDIYGRLTTSVVVSLEAMKLC